MLTPGSLTNVGKVRSQAPKVSKASMNVGKGPLRSDKYHYYEGVVYEPNDRRYIRRC